MYAIYCQTPEGDRWLDPEGIPGPPERAMTFMVATNAIDWAYRLKRALGLSDLKLSPCSFQGPVKPKGKAHGFVALRGRSLYCSDPTENQSARTSAGGIQEAARFSMGFGEELLSSPWALGDPDARLAYVTFGIGGMNL